jgi:hypothetical protein
MRSLWDNAASEWRSIAKRWCRTSTLETACAECGAMQLPHFLDGTVPATYNEHYLSIRSDGRIMFPTHA